MKVMFADIEPTPQGPVFGQLYSPTAAQMSNYYSSLSNIASSYGISIEGSTNMLNGKHLRPDPKPLFSATDPVVELGEALECYLLAGRSTSSEPRMTVPSRPSGGLGLAWIPWVSSNPAMTKNSLHQDVGPLIWVVSARSIGRMFGFATSTATIAQPVSIELTPARALERHRLSMRWRSIRDAIPSATSCGEERCVHMVQWTGKR